METNEIHVQFRKCIKSLYALAHLTKDSFIRMKIIENADNFFDTALLFSSEKIIYPLTVQIEVIEALLPIWEYTLKLNKTAFLEFYRDILLLKKFVLKVQNQSSFNNVKSKKIATEHKQEGLTKYIKTREKLSTTNFNELQEKIIELLIKKGKLTSTELCNELRGTSSRTLRRNMEPLIKSQKIEKKISGNIVYYQAQIVK